jgi:hypothetical protein
MQHVLPNYLRDRKSPWKWPKGFPECKEATELRKTIKKAIDENWIDKLEGIYE